MNPPRDPPGCNCKRILLIVNSSLQIAGWLILAACSKFFADAFAQQNKEIDRTIFLVTFLVIALLGLGIQLLGLLGALLHNVCLTATYTVFTLLGAISTLIGVFKVGPLYLASTVWSVGVTIIALLFIRDLRIKRENERLRQPVQLQAYPVQYA